MKKNIAMLIVIFTACMQAMENVDSNFWSITVEKTKIILNKGNIVDFYIDGTHKIDFIVVDRYATRKNDPCGLRQNYLLHKNKDKILEISMSQIGISPHLEVFYERYNPYKLYRVTLTTDGCPIVSSTSEVVIEALKDLDLCYNKAFSQAIELKKEKLIKSIALPVLSIGSYASQFKNSCDLEYTATKHIAKITLEFIKNNPDIYDCIELFVEEDFEFNWYKDLLKTFKINPKIKNIYWGK
ncbi:MAG TPA: hypothetical protein VHX42_00555 [Candidatus Babeliales bacterium]|nr:hypothetical protein [Candidatus Babeliales bacterium]